MEVTKFKGNALICLVTVKKSALSFTHTFTSNNTCLHINSFAFSHIFTNEQQRKKT